LSTGNSYLNSTGQETPLSAQDGVTGSLDGYTGALGGDIKALVELLGAEENIKAKTINKAQTANTIIILFLLPTDSDTVCTELSSLL